MFFFKSVMAHKFKMDFSTVCFVLQVLLQANYTSALVRQFWYHQM
jgi:hypothetical protein